MDSDHCPACGGSKILGGAVFGGSREVEALSFSPDNVRSWYSDNVRLSGPTFRCCWSCGHLWSRVDPGALRSLVEQHGDALTKQYLGLVDPVEGLLLPDLDEVCDARRKVAEVDELVRLGKQGEATRRFRELSGGTWDQAIDATRLWRELGLLEKLDRFGWRPKGHAGDDSAGRPEHPLHDASLDG